MYDRADLYLLNRSRCTDRFGVAYIHDVVKGIELLKKAAHAGFVPACMRLGRIYEHGGAEQKREWQQAAFWFTKAADQGNAEAQRRLGYMFMYGDHMSVPSACVQAVPPEEFDIPFRDEDKAAGWFAKIAQNCDYRWTGTQLHQVMHELGLLSHDIDSESDSYGGA
jgi:TPR repeat protein